jgi:hypothetical protein
MTATVEETATPDATADASAPATPEPKVIPVPLDEFGQIAFSKLEAQINEYNSLAKVVKAVDGDPTGILLEFKENYTEDETVNKVRAKIAELNDTLAQLEGKFDELLKPIVDKAVAEKKESLGDAPERLKKLGGSINLSRKYLADTYCEEVLEGLPALEGKGKSGGKAGTGEGGRRIRGFDFFMDGTRAFTRDQKGKENSSAAAVALLMKKDPYNEKIETEDVRKAFWNAAGTDDPAKYPNELTFTLPYGPEDDRKLVTVKAVRTSDGSSDE